MSHDEPATTAAIDRGKGYIKTRLKAPSTADFSGEYATNNGDGTWSVIGSVDAENSFGAKIRSDWTCTARDQGGGIWSVVEGNVSD